MKAIFFSLIMACALPALAQPSCLVCDPPPGSSVQQESQTLPLTKLEDLKGNPATWLANPLFLDISTPLPQFAPRLIVDRRKPKNEQFARKETSHELEVA